MPKVPLWLCYCQGLSRAYFNFSPTLSVTARCIRKGRQRMIFFLGGGGSLTNCVCKRMNIIIRFRPVWEPSMFGTASFLGLQLVQALFTRSCHEDIKYSKSAQKYSRSTPKLSKKYSKRTPMEYSNDSSIPQNSGNDLVPSPISISVKYV